MTERDDAHLRQLRHLMALDLDTDPPVAVWWWTVSEEERDFSAAMSAAAAADFDDPESLFAFWHQDAVTIEQRRHIEDLTKRVRKHLQDGTGVRRVDGMRQKTED